MTFTIVVTNEGPSDATGVDIEDVVPNGYGAISSISDGGTVAGNVITWTDFSIISGANATVTFDAEVLAPGEGVDFDNVAQVSAADQFDPDSEAGNGVDPDGDGLIGSEDDNPNDGSVDPDDEDDADNEPTTPQVADLNLAKTVNDPTPTLVTW